MTADPNGPTLTGAHLAQANGFDLRLAPNTVLVFDAALVPSESTVDRVRSRLGRMAGPSGQGRHPFRKVHPVANDTDLVLAAGPGPAVAAVTVEFLAGLGARRVISVGVAAALTPIESGTTRCIASATADETVSARYQPPQAADATLTSALAERLGAAPIRTLTTATPFRHGPGFLASHRASCAVTEMECSVLLSAGPMFGLAVAPIVVISDHYDGDEWYLGTPEQVPPALGRAVDTAVDTLLSTGPS